MRGAGVRGEIFEGGMYTHNNYFSCAGRLYVCSGDSTEHCMQQDIVIPSFIRLL